MVSTPDGAGSRSIGTKRATSKMSRQIRLAQTLSSRFYERAPRGLAGCDTDLARLRVRTAAFLSPCLSLARFDRLGPRRHARLETRHLSAARRGFSPPGWGLRHLALKPRSNSPSRPRRSRPRPCAPGRFGEQPRFLSLSLSIRCTQVFVACGLLPFCPPDPRQRSLRTGLGRRRPGLRPLGRR